MKKLILAVVGILLFSTNLIADTSFYDSFDGTGNIAWQVKKGFFSIENERYLAQSEVIPGQYELAIATAGLLIDEGSVQTKFQFKTEDVPDLRPNAFIVFGYQDNSNYYIVGVRPGCDECVLEKIERGLKTCLVSRYLEDLARGVNYTIKVVLQDGTVAFYINDVERFTYSLGAIPPGEAGLAVHCGVSYFDDVQIALFNDISVPPLIRFQGNITDALGAPLSGAFTLTFRVYDTDIGGLPLWEEIQENINIENGLLDVELGSVTSIELPFDRQYWLGVEVELDGEMTPRFKLTSVPYAFVSEQ